MIEALLAFAVVVAAVYLAAVLALVAAGQRIDARVLVRFIPDCVVLVRRLLSDPRVPRRSKIALVGLAIYLVLPFDLVPDFIPVVGQLDDAVLVALTIRHLVRASGPQVVAEHWPGPARGLRALMWLAYSPGGWRTT